jgi:pyruvate-formate lyase-activating enzyme
MYYDDYYKKETKPEFRLQNEALGCLPLSPYSSANPEKTFNLLEAFDGPAMRKTRLSMLAGEKVAACKYCYEREDSGGTSYRQTANRMFADQVDFPRLLAGTAENGSLNEFPFYLDIRFGNTCNLQCVMCGFPISSRWGKATGIQWVEANINPYAMDTELWTILNEYAPRIRRIYFAGGEPFLQPSHFKLLELLIDNGCAADIDLGYNTNLTVLPEGIFEKLGKFKSVDIGASCDGTEDVFESIRAGAKWDTFVKNVRETKKHFRVRLAVTPQKGNIANLAKLIEWAVAEECDMDLTNVLLYPEELSICALGKEEKRYFADQYRSLSAKYAREGYESISGELENIVRVLTAAGG